MKIGHGLFSRAESYQLFTAEHDGYIYTLQDEKNFNRQRGYRIEKRDGGNEWVYILTKRRKGWKRIVGLQAHSIYESIRDELCRNDLYKRLGFDTFSVKVDKDTKIYSFRLHEAPETKNGKRVLDKEKTECVIYYQPEYVSDYFPTLEACCAYAESKLTELDKT